MGWNKAIQLLRIKVERRGRPEKRWFDSTGSDLRKKGLFGEEMHNLAANVIVHRPCIKVGQR